MAVRKKAVNPDRQKSIDEGKMMSDHKKRIDDVMEPLHGEERKSDGDGQNRTYQ